MSQKKKKKEIKLRQIIKDEVFLFIVWIFLVYIVLSLREFSILNDFFALYFASFWFWAHPYVLTDFKKFSLQKYLLFSFVFSFSVFFYLDLIGPSTAPIFLMPSFYILYLYLFIKLQEDFQLRKVRYAK